MSDPDTPPLIEFDPRRLQTRTQRGQVLLKVWKEMPSLSVRIKAKQGDSKKPGALDETDSATYLLKSQRQT